MENELSLRNQAFIDCCRQIVRERRMRARTLSIAEMLDEALATKPERHFADYTTCLREMYRRRAGLVPATCRTMNAERWDELYSQVLEVMKRRPSLTFPRAVAFTISSRRPSRFFIPRRVARRLLLDAISLENLIVIA